MNAVTGLLAVANLQVRMLDYLVIRTCKCRLQNPAARACSSEPAESWFQ